MIEQQKFDGACDDIAQGKFYQAFSALAELYSDGDENDRQAVYALLTDVFYTPNYDALKENYKNNKELLKEYPYWFGPNIPAFEDLGFLIFPCDGNICFIYHKDDDTFREVEVNSETETKYFFNSKFKPVFTCDEMNEYNLRFLVDTFRASEDVAMDNHIYLYYENPDLLFALIQVIEIDYILVKKKIIFLLGNENKNIYPINFKELFGINYNDMEPKQLRIGELNRITPVISLVYTGVFMLCQIYNAHSDVIMFHVYHFIIQLIKHDKYDKFIEKLNDKTYTVDYETLCSSIGEELAVIITGEQDLFFDILHQITSEKGKMTIPDWFQAISIAKYYQENGDAYISRVIPAIFWEFHYGRLKNYNTILDSFKYKKVLSIMRNPVIRFERFINYNINKQLDTSAEQLAFLYDKSYSADVGDMKWNCVVYEELKENPQQSSRLLCRIMGVPYDPKMLYSEIYPLNSFLENEFGERLQGFTKSSIERNDGEKYSELDRLRLDILYTPIYERYGYPYSNNIDDLSDDEIILLFSLPYRFEKYLMIPPPGDIEDIHEQVVEVMCRAYFISREKEGIIYPEMLSFDYLE